MFHTYVASVFIWMVHMFCNDFSSVFRWFYKCFRCMFQVFQMFLEMLQVFYTDVAKVDRDVAYVKMVLHICCKLLFPMFHLFFQTCVAIVFIWVLHIFHTYVECVS